MEPKVIAESVADPGGEGGRRGQSTRVWIRPGGPDEFDPVVAIGSFVVDTYCEVGIRERVRERERVFFTTFIHCFVVEDSITWYHTRLTAVSAGL